MALAAIVIACTKGTASDALAAGRGAPQAGHLASAGSVAPATAAPESIVAKRPSLSAEEKAFYRDMARSAWSYMLANYQPSTGLVSATPEWANTTMWDVGGQIIAFRAARELGLIAADDYDRRTQKLLATLEKLALYDQTAFSKLYSTTTGARSAESRVGWTATDLGRLFLALKILAVHEPKYAAQAERIVRRNNFAKIVSGGYLYGMELGSTGKPWRYQEGRIGYEQYVANGFSRWGADVANALDVKKNGEPVDVMGVQLLADRRYDDRLLSEPFVLYGLELGLNGDMRDLATNVLKAQEARYRATGTITIVSEDAVAIPPEYFYYYCVYCLRKPFVIAVNSGAKERDTPRWVSTKAAFGWNAIMPTEYTKTAIDYVAAAKDPARGWATGVMEGTRASTKSFDVNTASVLLEVALYQLRGGTPLIEPAAVQP